MLILPGDRLPIDVFVSVVLVLLVTILADLFNFGPLLTIIVLIALGLVEVLVLLLLPKLLGRK